MTLFIKPMIWDGAEKVYLGFTPSNPQAHPCNRLGSYFLVVQDRVQAWSIARSFEHEGIEVVECPVYIGFDRRVVTP